MMHSSTIAGSMSARRTASRTTRAPRSGAEKPLRVPRNLPVGVRTALTMTGSATNDQLANRILTEKTLQACEDDARRSVHLARPVRRVRFDDEHASLEVDVGNAPDGGAYGRLPREIQFGRRHRRLREQ